VGHPRFPCASIATVAHSVMPCSSGQYRVLNWKSKPYSVGSLRTGRYGAGSVGGIWTPATCTRHPEPMPHSRQTFPWSCRARTLAGSCVSPIGVSPLAVPARTNVFGDRPRGRKLPWPPAITSGVLGCRLVRAEPTGPRASVPRLLQATEEGA